MDAAEQLKDDLQTGRLKPDRLVDLIVDLQRQLHAANQRIADLEKQLTGSSAKVDEPYSLRAEEKRQDARGKKKRKAPRKGRRGRLSTADKIAKAEREVDVLPDGLSKSDCHLSHTRPVWRLENGRAVLVAYHIYRGPNDRYGKIPGVLGRSEFSLEIMLAIAHLVYVVGLSFDKVGLVFNFFQNLQLTKSQADALLHQLARHWRNEFEILCTLLANSLIVHTDETSWSLNSVWAFLSENARLLFFGVHKDADTLKEILDPATFAGTVISDDAAVYANFTKSQKCWAHLLRKAIKLTLEEPNNAEYRRFADRLLEIYR
jgi:transposase